MQSSSSIVYGTISYEGKNYKTVVIGSQTWMAENLNVGVFLAGDSSVQQDNDSVVEKFCYDNIESNCDVLGGLYQWSEAMNLPNECNEINCSSQLSTTNHQGICPSGWHIPTASDWNTLANQLGGADVAAFQMKAYDSTYVKWNAAAYNDGNSSGFSALPTGSRLWDGQFSYPRSGVLYWEPNLVSFSGATERYLYSTGQELISTSSERAAADPVRCIKN